MYLSKIGLCFRFLSLNLFGLSLRACINFILGIIMIMMIIMIIIIIIIIIIKRYQPILDDDEDNSPGKRVCHSCTMVLRSCGIVKSSKKTQTLEVSRAFS